MSKHYLLLQILEKMVTETYTFLKIVYGNEGLSHVGLALTELRETGRVMTSHLTELVARDH
jgi:hypothetical protein